MSVTKDVAAGLLVGSDTRDLILDSVERLLGRYGYQKMTMDDIAREAGVGRRTIYLHFTGKEEVALCSIDRVVERVQERLREIAADMDLSMPERLRRMLIERVLTRFDSVHDYHESLDSLFEALRPAYMARRELYFDAEAKVFQAVLEEGRRDGTLSVADAPQTARALLLATNALLPYSLSARELGKREEIAARAELLADLVLNGVVRRGQVTGDRVAEGVSPPCSL